MNRGENCFQVGNDFSKKKSPQLLQRWVAESHTFQQGGKLLGEQVYKKDTKQSFLSIGEIITDKILITEKNDCSRGNSGRP